MSNITNLSCDEVSAVSGGSALGVVCGVAGAIAGGFVSTFLTVNGIGPLASDAFSLGKYRHDRSGEHRTLPESAYRLTKHLRTAIDSVGVAGGYLLAKAACEHIFG